MRAVNLDGGTDGQIGQEVGKEAAFYTVYAELKAVASGGRSDGVGAGLLLAVLVQRQCGDELAGGIGKAFQTLEDKEEVIALVSFRKAILAHETCCIKLTSQSRSRFAGKIRAVPEFMCHFEVREMWHLLPPQRRRPAAGDPG